MCGAAACSCVLYCLQLAWTNTRACPPNHVQARIAETEAEIGTPLLGQLSAAEQAEVRQLQPQVTQLQVSAAGGGRVRRAGFVGWWCSAFFCAFWSVA